MTTTNNKKVKLTTENAEHLIETLSLNLLLSVNFIREHKDDYVFDHEWAQALKDRDARTDQLEEAVEEAENNDEVELSDEAKLLINAALRKSYICRMNTVWEKIDQLNVSDENYFDETFLLEDKSNQYEKAYKALL